MELTAQNVESIAQHSLFSDSDVARLMVEHRLALTGDQADKADVARLVDLGLAVMAEGVVSTFVFDAKKVETHRADVQSMLEQLPKPFLPASRGGGGGWSFLNLCNREDGVQWSSFHSTMESLCCLAIALDLGQWMAPREIWAVLPGGMPYFGLKE